MGKTGKRIALGSSIAVAGLAAAGIAHYAAMGHLGRIAFDRDYQIADTPKNRERIKGSADNVEFMQYRDLCAARFRKVETKAVTVTSADGTRLQGHWLPARDPKRIVIAMHGWRSDWLHDFGMVWKFFLRQGCSVLYAEQRGQNNSDGKYIGFGVLERHDCLAWTKWAVTESQGILPVYLAGVSMGATTVLMASDLALPEQVKGVIADCGFTSIQAIGQHVVKNNLHLHMPMTNRMMDFLCKKRLKVGAGEHTTTQALRNTRLPVLLVHGQADSFVPVSMSYENYGCCRSPKELLVVPGADHGMSYYLEPKRYQNAVLRFWEKYDN